MSFGLTPAGFQPKRLPDVKADMEARLIEAFSDPDLRSESIFGQLVGINSELAALLWALAEDVYSSQYPDTATGNSLDNVVSLNGIMRRPATSTAVTAIAFGTPGTLLPQGREARNRRTQDFYRSTAAVTISLANAVQITVQIDTVEDADYTITIDGVDYTHSASSETGQQILTALAALVPGDVTTTLNTGSLVLATADARAWGLSANLASSEAGTPVPMRAVVPGPSPLPIGDLTEIATPVAGWARVNNLQPGITGTARERDQELRARRERSIRVTGRQTLPAIEARIIALDDVIAANVVSNNGTDTDSFGTPRQHVWAIVDGGTDDEIAEVLFSTVAAGIGYRGNEVVLVESEITGKPYEVRFDRPTLILPNISIEYERLSVFPADGEARIREALVNRTYQIGEKLVASQLYTQVNTVPGVQIDLLEIDTGASAVPRIEPAPNERIVIDVSNITLTDVT